MAISTLHPVEEAEDVLTLEEQYAAIVEAAGAWTDENHPELRNEEDIDRWLAKLRTSGLVPKPLPS